KSPWMLLTVVPAGFLLLAGVAALEAGQWETPSTMFAACAALALVVGGVFAFRGRATEPSVEDLRRFAREWLRGNPTAAEPEVRTALARRFSGTRSALDLETSVGMQEPEGQIGSGCLAALITFPIL